MDISAGLMYNYYVINGDHGFFPGIDLGLRINETFRLTSGLNYSMRLPSFTEMYYVGPDNRGNKNLKPEKAWSFETGIQWNKQSFAGSMVAFLRKGTNIIDWLWNEADELWISDNINQLNTYGLETTMGYSTNNSNVRNLFISRIDFSYSFINQSEQNSDEQSKYALNPIRHKISGELKHQFPGGFGLAWLFNYQDRAGKYLMYTSETETYSEKDYTPFSTVNLKLSKSIKAFNVYLKISNLFDTPYIDFGNIQQPGRWISTGIVWNPKR